MLSLKYSLSVIACFAFLSSVMFLLTLSGGFYNLEHTPLSAWLCISGGSIWGLPSPMWEDQETPTAAGESLQARPHLHCDGQGARGQGQLGQHPPQDQPAGGQVWEWLSRLHLSESTVWGTEGSWDWGGPCQVSRPKQNLTRIVLSMFLIKVFVSIRCCKNWICMYFALCP